MDNIARCTRAKQGSHQDPRPHMYRIAFCLLPCASRPPNAFQQRPPSIRTDYGWDPLCLGSNPESLNWYRQAELQNGRWAMLGVAGILGAEIFNPNQFWYTAGQPENLPDLEFGGPVNVGGLLAWEFLLMHFVEVRVESTCGRGCCPA